MQKQIFTISLSPSSLSSSCCTEINLKGLLMMKTATAGCINAKQCKTNPIDGYGSLSSSSYTRHLSHHQFHFNTTIIIIRKTEHKDKSQIVFHYHHHQIYQRLEISCLEYLPKDSLQSETIPHWNHSLRVGWCVIPQGLNCCQFPVTNNTPI